MHMLFVLLPAVAAAASVFDTSSQTSFSTLPYDFAILNTGNATDFQPLPMPLCHGIDIEEGSLSRLQKILSAGALTSVQLTSCYLDRMRQVDHYIHSVLELNPDVLAIAHETDLYRAQNSSNISPLHGIPFLVKDNYATKDKLQTTCGSLPLLGSIVPRDAHLVAKLRSAGAVLLGKASLSEWADMRSNSYSEGYSARGGQARTPYNLTMNPGGSSSGSGAAVAANVVPFALGTETDGSIIMPAERCGVVGFKPTVGLTSRNGVIPESEHQDTTGPLAKTVADAAAVLDAVYGVDPRDNYTYAQVGKTPDGGYSQFLSNYTALDGAVFGLPWESFWQYADADVVEELLQVVKLVEEAGATIINGTEIPSRNLTISPDGWDWDLGVSARNRPNESEYTVVKVDFYNNLQTYLSELSNTNVRTLQDIVDYNNANTGTEGGIPDTHPAFESGQDGLLASLEWGGIKNSTYYQAIAFCQRTTREEGIDGALAQGPNGTQLDGLLVPPSVAQTYQIAAQAGYPMISLPVAIEESTGMPKALAIMGTAWSEPGLVRYGSAVEDLLEVKGRRGRVLPRFREILAGNIPVV